MTDKYVPWTILQKHLQHAIKVLHNTFPPRINSAPKPLTATLMQEVVTMHETFGVLTYGKNKFALKYSNSKGMPSGFSHFYCLLSTQTNVKGFSTSAGGS